MRYIVAFLVFTLLASWSVLVHSYIRSGTDILRYDNLLKDCEPLQKLSVDSDKGWKALARFYPLQLIEKLSSVKPGNLKDSDEEKSNSTEGVVDGRHINHLVEIYLRSHSLAACGHKEAHETVGTLCSVSQGTEFYALYKEIMTSMYRQGAIDSRAFLYLLESEPSDWSIDEPFFFMNDKIVSSTVSVSDIDVETKRQQLIKEGFQTAGSWSYDDVRKAIVNSKNGERLSDIDSNLGVSRGELRMILSNCLVRPLFLLRNWDNECYQGALDGLIPFIAQNIGRDLGVSELNKIRTKLDVAVLPEVVLAHLDSPVLEKQQKVVPSGVRDEVHVAPDQQKKSAIKVQSEPVTSGKSQVSTVPVKVKVQAEEKKKSFARSYGGSRFHMSWAN